MMKHKCRRCGRSFARSEHLSRHERSHTKEKPFSCTRCSQAFTRKDLLSRHTRIHHASSTPTSGRLERTTDYMPAKQPPTCQPTLEIGSADSSIFFYDFQTTVNAPLAESTTSAASTFLPSAFGESSPSQPPETTATQELNEIQDPTHRTLDFWSPSFPVDFSTYMDTVGQPTGPFSLMYQPLPFYGSPEFEGASTTRADFVGMANSTIASGLEGLQDPRSALTSRPPSAQPPLHPRGKHVVGGRNISFNTRIKVDARCRNAMLLQLGHFQHVLPFGFDLPTQHTLNRFVHGWLTVFNNHYPMIHLPSLCLPNIAVELFLAIASLGAQYCYERNKGKPLFDMSKIIAMERLKMYSSRDPLAITGSSNYDIGVMRQTAQALILLIAISMWSQSEPSIRDALFLRSSLLSLLHDENLEFSSANTPAPTSLEMWIKYETAKRTKMVGFCILNLLTIAFDMPPVLMYNEMQLTMPCDEQTWTTEWPEKAASLQNVESDEACFLDMLSALLSSDSTATASLASSSSLGSYVLIHAIIQHVWILHQTGAIGMRTQDDNDTLEIDQTLRRWQQECWKRDQSASKDPVNPAGPLSFTSIALLRLAYIRVATKSRFTGYLNIWDPEKIGQALYQGPGVQRGDKASRVALHCAQAIAIPIKTGLNFVAHTQVFYWSNQYALCSFECALLLSKWLEAVTKENLSPPRSPKEEKVLDFVLQLIAETEYEMSKEELLIPKTLSILVVRLWSRLFRRDHVWELVSIIGMSLEAFANCLEQQTGT